MPKGNFIDHHFPKPIAKMFETFKSPETLGKNPLARKYVMTVREYQDAQASLGSSFVNQALAQGIAKNPTRRELAKLGFREGSYKKNVQKYWENMSDKKEAGQLLEYNTIYDKVYKAAIEAGVPVPQYVENYLPKMIKSDIAEIIFNDLSLLASKTRGATSILNSLSSTRKFIKNNPNKAEELENLIINAKLKNETRRVLKLNMNPKSKYAHLEAFSKMGRASYNDLYGTFGNLEKSRKPINMPDGYWERDFRKLTQSYFYGAAKRIAEAKTFGAKGEKFKALKKSVSKDGNFKQADMMDEVQSHLVGSIHKDPKYALSPKGKKLSEAVMAFETSTKIALGTATIPNTSQFMISSALDAGYFRFFRGFMSLADPKVRDFINKSGATEFSMLTELLGTSPSRGLNTTGAKVADFLATYSGFKGINKINQYTAAATARVFIKDLHKIANKSPIDVRRKWAQDKLSRMGLNYKSKLTEKSMLNGTNRYARDMNLQKDVLKDPLIMNNPRAQWAFQFKRFGYRQAKLIDNVIRDDLKRGNVMSVLRLGVAGFAGAPAVSKMKQWYKEFWSGEPSFDPSAEKLPEDFEELIQGISAVGALGMFGDMLSSAVSVGESPTEAITFMFTPAVLSSAEKLMDFGLAIEADSQKYGIDAIKRVPVHASKIFGTVPSQFISRIEPKGMSEEKLKGRKAFTVKKINKYLDSNMFKKARGLAKAWNKTHPQDVISISMRKRFKRIMEKNKLRRKNKINIDTNIKLPFVEDIDLFNL